MQRWTTLIALVAITFLSAAPAKAFHHGRRGCGYGGCGYVGYSGCGGGWCGAAPYGGAPYAWGGYRAYGYGAYPLVSNNSGASYSGVVHNWNPPSAYNARPITAYYMAPGYSIASPGSVPVRPYAAPSVASGNINVASRSTASATGTSAPPSASGTTIARRP